MREPRTTNGNLVVGAFIKNNTYAVSAKRAGAKRVDVIRNDDGNRQWRVRRIKRYPKDTCVALHKTTKRDTTTP